VFTKPFAHQIFDQLLSVEADQIADTLTKPSPIEKFKSVDIFNFHYFTRSDQADHLYIDARVTELLHVKCTSQLGKANMSGHG